jgi:hypothetical protein
MLHFFPKGKLFESADRQLTAAAGSILTEAET